MKTISLLGKKFKMSVSRSRVRASIDLVAERINSDYEGKDVFLLVVLNGAFMFATDLIRKLKMPCYISFVKIASYRGEASEGIIRELIGLKEDLNGKHVILVEDIVDTGFTLEHIMNQIRTNFNPASIAVASLLFKPQSYRKSITIDYVGLEIPNDFVVGCGLDYNCYGRNFEEIYVIES